MRGLAGFLVIIALAVAAGLLESSLTQVLGYIGKGISENRLLFLLSLWYLAGVVLNLLLRGRGLDDWRLMLDPVILLIGMCFAFAFLRNDSCFRYFQVYFIIVLGIQAALSSNVMSETVSIAREMVTQTAGAWIFGNQSLFATLAMLLPILLWRSFQETGVLRILLLASCILILITVSISTFATPLGLIILSIFIVSVLSILFPLKTSRWQVLLVVGMLVVMALLVYRATSESPLLASAYYRIANIIDDPTSGGYAGSDLPGSRWLLDEISIRSFEAEPLFGMGGGSTRLSEYVGGHSSALDSLGAYGLLGGGGAFIGIILLLMVRAVARLWRERTWEALLALTSVLLLIVGGIVNPYWEGYQPLYILLMARPFLRTVKYEVPRWLKAAPGSFRQSPNR